MKGGGLLKEKEDPEGGGRPQKKRPRKGKGGKLWIPEFTQEQVHVESIT